MDEYFSALFVQSGNLLFHIGHDAVMMDMKLNLNFLYKLDFYLFMLFDG